MKIISQFKDYYDSSVGLGIDESIHYIRKKDIIENNIPDELINLTKYNRHYSKNYSFIKLTPINICSTFSVAVVGFCGEYIPLYIFSNVHKITTSYYTYDIEEAKSMLKPFKKIQKNTLERVEIEIKKFNKLDYFRLYNSPYFVVFGDFLEEKSIVINIKLKDILFYKKYDPYTTFQKISMFISGVLGNIEKDNIEISDKSKIVGHGYDYKYSFRNRPKN